MASKRPPKGPKNGQSGPFWPVLACLPQKDLAIFRPPGAKKSKFFFCPKSLFMTPQRVWEPQKPKIGPLEPANDPLLGHFLCILAHLGPKKCDFLEKKFSLQITFKPSRKGLGPSKTQNWPSGATQRPHLGQFGCILGNLDVFWPVLAHSGLF